MTPSTNVPFREHIDVSGSAYPSKRHGFGPRKNQSQADTRSAFHGLDFPVGGLPVPESTMLPYVVKDGAFKFSGHPEDRMLERTPFHPKYTETLRNIINKLNLKPSSYYIPLRNDKNQIEGYAQFKNVKNQKKPILATILSKFMTPNGRNLENQTNFLKPPLRKQSAQLAPADPYKQNLFDTDHIDSKPPESTGWLQKFRALGRSEPLSYELRKGFDQVTFGPKNEVIENSYNYTD